MLDDLNIEQFSHLHGSARDHLIRVHNFLAQWGNPSAVCVAGLFHNIYGTEMFKPKAADLSRRPEIAKVIGGEAEELAFLFCVSRRIGFFDDQADPARPLLWDEVNKQKIVTTPERIAALIEIEIANGMEQYSPDLGLLEEELAYLLKMAEWMYQKAAAKVTINAKCALEGMISSLRQDLQTVRVAHTI
jgi:hypothetical protein